MKNILISFLSPKKVELQGLWLGNDRAETAYIFLHGLGGSIFSRSSFLELIASQKNTAVLTFNNRGFGLINSFKLKKAENQTDYLLAGMAHEKFNDCLDDIAGAINYTRQRGVKNIYLIGHSTGCQKIIYYLAHRPKEKISGAIFLAPMSDYAGIDVQDKDYRSALKAALSLKEKGKGDQLLAHSLWPHYISAQRFLSLYTPDSQEEIFTYASNKNPKLLKKLNTPSLVILAEADEYSDRPMLEIKDWFDKILASNKKYQSVLVKDALHSFKDKDQELLKLIKLWQS